MSKKKISIPAQARTLDKPIQWCEYIIKAGYATVAVTTLAHIVWYFAARGTLIHPPKIYLRDYIILPSIGLLALNLIADFFVRSYRMPLVFKEYTVLILFIIFSFYLCLTHKIATVLFGSFVLPVFTSTIFSNIKMTRCIFGISNLALLTGIAYTRAGYGTYRKFVYVSKRLVTNKERFDILHVKDHKNFITIENRGHIIEDIRKYSKMLFRPLPTTEEFYNQ